MNECICHVISHIHRDDSFTYATETHSFTSRDGNTDDAFTHASWCIRITWRIRISANDSFMHATRCIHMYDMTHSYTWRDAFTQVTWLLNNYDMTHSYTRRDVFAQVTWLFQLWQVTGSRDDAVSVADVNASPSWKCRVAYVNIWKGFMYRVAKMYRMPQVAGLFPQKSQSL